jgi:hypothetical protein
VECWTKRRVKEVEGMLGRKAVRLTAQDYLFMCKSSGACVMGRDRAW